MDQYGCVVTSVANLLLAAGYETDPGQVVDKLNSINGFTERGLLIWGKVEEAYPQFHFGGGGVRFRKGLLGKDVHWLLEYNGTITDPITGKEGVPEGWKETEGGREAGIDRAEAPAVEPEPEAPAEGGPRTYTVVEGDSLSKIAQKELGDGNRWPEIFDLNKDQIADPDLIYPDQVLKLP